MLQVQIEAEKKAEKPNWEKIEKLHNELCDYLDKVVEWKHWFYVKTAKDITASMQMTTQS